MEIINSNDKKAYTPVLEGELYIETYRSSIPSKACFNVIKDSIIDFSEGSTVKIYADSIPIFWGYVFTKTRNKEGIISVTAYDQLRYLKNKATYNFNGFTVSGIIKQIASDYMINCGSIEDSGFIINNMTSDEKTLFDIIQSAIDTTYLSTGNLYVLFDDFGKLSLKKAENMASNYIVKDDTAED